MQISKNQARRFLLAYQGLTSPYEYQGKSGVLNYIDRVGCIQFDPLNIVGHNSELVLQARVAGFLPEMLQDLLYEGRKLLDGLDKNMSIYRVKDWPYFERLRERARRKLGKSTEAVRSVLPKVREAIKHRGPLSSLDLKFDEMVEWDWSESRLARAALESMYLWGELVIHHRVHTRKMYDFAHRCLPEELLLTPDPNETIEQYHDWHVHRRIGSVGMLWDRSGEAWLGIHSNHNKSSIASKERKAALERLVDQSAILQVEVKGIREPFYLRSQDLPLFDQVLAKGASPPRAIVTAPLDNLLWDRRMIKKIFNFDYKWEVYVPKAKRRYGYYVLPILYGDRFVARYEPGHDKKRGLLSIKNWWWEAEVNPSEQMKNDIVLCFNRFLQYLGANRLEVDHQPLEKANLDWLVAHFS